LQASNVIDKWVGEPFTWVINIHEPWWRRSVLIGSLLAFLLVLIAVNFFLYNRNTRLRVQRSSNEGDMVRRIQNFAERCDEYNKEMIDVVQNDPNAVSSNNEADLSKEFIDMMVIVLPYIKEQNGKFTIRELVDLTGLDVSSFFQIISSNLYKSPRALTRVMRLMQVQEMLRNTSKSVEEISVDCHFASPNCLISSFFHQFRMTPRDYRLSI
jgi:AraC-like DNA-binding protein